MGASKQNYAQFESRIADEWIYSRMSDVNASSVLGISSVSWFGSVAQTATNIIDYIATTSIVFFAIGYVIYLIFWAIKHGPEMAMKSLQSLAWWVQKYAIRLYHRVAWRRIFRVFGRVWQNRLLWIAIIGVYSFIVSVWSGQSALMKIVRIPDGMVWVDLRNAMIMQPGYHAYSPLMSEYLLSPTNTFDFEIVEATANTSEELAVSLDRRVWFEFLEEKRLDFYRQYGSKDIRTVSSDIVMPALLESIKKVIYQYSFKDLLTQSDNIKAQTMELASTKLAEKWIALQYLNIIDIRLPESYLTSKEELLKAENERKLAEAALETQKKKDEKRLIEAESNKKIKVIQAEAIAEYNRIVSEQNISESLLEMRKIDVQESRIKKRDGKMPQTINGGMNW